MFILTPFILGSQESSAINQPPFASYLSAQVNDSRVVLNWQDPSDTENLIYEVRRCSEEITEDNLEQSDFIANVAPGIRNFTDSPPGEGSWWYALISIKNGKTVKLVIPWRNSLGIPVNLNTETAEQIPEPEEVISKPELPELSHPAPIRPAPLPLLALDSMPLKRTLSLQAAAALNNILEPDEGELWVQAEPEILPVDLTRGDEVSHSILKGILEGPFARKEWLEAETGLIELSASLELDNRIVQAPGCLSLISGFFRLFL